MWPIYIFWSESGEFPIAEESNDDITENPNTGYIYDHGECEYQDDDVNDVGTDEDNVYYLHILKTLFWKLSHLYVSHNTPVLNSMEPGVIGRKRVIEGPRTADVKISDM